MVISFIVAGIFFYILDKQKNQIALGKVLLVRFVSTLLVTTFAMHILYGMIPSSFTFLMNVIWVGLRIYLSHFNRSQEMGVMFAVAGYFLSFLVEGSETYTSIILFIAYELVYYIALLWFTTCNYYRILFYVSTIFLQVVY